MPGGVACVEGMGGLGVWGSKGSGGSKGFGSIEGVEGMWSRGVRGGLCCLETVDVLSKIIQHILKMETFFAFCTINN